MKGICDQIQIAQSLHNCWEIEKASHKRSTFMRTYTHPHVIQIVHFIRFLHTFITLPKQSVN